MVAFTQLREANIAATGAAAQACGQLSRQAETLEQRVVSELTGPLRTSGWKGPAAAAAFERMYLLDEEYELAAVPVQGQGVW